MPSWAKKIILHFIKWLENGCERRKEKLAIFVLTEINEQ